MITSRRVVLVDGTSYFLPEMIARFPENEIPIEERESILRTENLARITVKRGKDWRTLRYKVMVDTQKGFKPPRGLPFKSCIKILEFLGLLYHIEAKENGKQVLTIDEFKKDGVVWIEYGFRSPLSEDSRVIYLAFYFKELGFVIEFCRFIHTLETVPFSI